MLLLSFYTIIIFGILLLLDSDAEPIARQDRQYWMILQNLGLHSIMFFNVQCEHFQNSHFLQYLNMATTVWKGCGYGKLWYG